MEKSAIFKVLAGRKSTMQWMEKGNMSTAVEAHSSLYLLKMLQLLYQIGAHHFLR